MPVTNRRARKDFSETVGDLYGWREPGAWWLDERFGSSMPWADEQEARITGVEPVENYVRIHFRHEAHGARGSVTVYPPPGYDGHDLKSHILPRLEGLTFREAGEARLLEPVPHRAPEFHRVEPADSRPDWN
jgi:hypothetical protein